MIAIQNLVCKAYHLNSKIQSVSISTQKQPSCKKGVAHIKKDNMKKVVKSKVAAQKWLRYGRIMAKFMITTLGPNS